MPDVLSRVAGIVDDDVGSTHLADYSYLGLRSFVVVDYTEPDIKYTLVGTAGGDDPDTGDIYRGLDRFGRVKDCYWYNYGNSTDVDRIKYGYDRNGNRTYRENTVATANNAYFDENYVNDLIDRLKRMDRGRLNAQKNGVTNKTFAQCWSLDATGNWRKFLEDSDGNGTWDFDQARTSNKVNEIVDINELTGPSWVTPVYNRAGNMTTIPKPADLTASFTGTYDAWNRLVKLEDGTGTVSQYEYDGAKRRTVKKKYSAGVLAETRHLFYTEPSRWQVLEERTETSTDAERQFVSGLRYVDDLILQERDTNADGTLDERLYAMQDANWNVTNVANASGSVQERYSYDAYGICTPLTPTFSFRDGSTMAWDVRYAGYRFDIESSHYAVRHRSYHPSFAWIQRDPLKIFAGFNLYQLYAYGNLQPLQNTDPRGLNPESVNPYQSPCYDPTIRTQFPLTPALIVGGCFLGGLASILNDLLEGQEIGSDLNSNICISVAGCIAGVCAALMFGSTTMSVLTGGIFVLAAIGVIAFCVWLAAQWCQQCGLHFNGQPPSICLI